MPVAVCPSAETLAAFACGNLSPDELAGVAEHVGGCGTCCVALKLLPEDSLADLARAAAVSPDTVQTPVQSPPTLPGAPGCIPAGFADHPRYRILGELGAGGMGTVYKAEDLWMGRTIAIKVVSAHLTAKASAVERFRKEIRAAAQLNHPSVITAHDTGEAGGCQFLVMEFFEGISLDRLVAKKGPLPPSMASTFMRQAALGLQHAADKGMVHRDIKPQNLMVTRKGQVKILDFGLARFAHADEDEEAPAGLPHGAGKALAAPAVTNPNLLLGTPDYLSPEQAKNSHAVDHRSDIYSLGCTLYFLLTGKAPFLGAVTLVDKLLAHTNETPPPIRAARPDVSTGLADVLAKMMAKKPGDRYQTAAEVAGALLPYTRADSAKDPVFEIVDAVAITPAPRAPMAAPAPRSGAVATPAPRGTMAAPAPLAKPAFDTAPVSHSPTLSETPRPKRAKKSKKAAQRKQRNRAIIGGAVAALILVGAIVFAASSRKKATDPSPEPTNTAKANSPSAPPQPKPDKSDKADKLPPAPVVIAPPTKGVQILYVLPSDGVWLDDFRPVRDHFVSKGATVVTASFEGDRSKPSPNSPPGPPVPIDVRLRPDMDLSDYSAVIFCGERSEEYMTGKGSFAAGKVIQRMQVAGKPVAAICLGQGVLIAHDVLRGKRAAHNRFLADKHPFMPWDKMNITWEKPGVVVDGKVVTATGPREAVPFADAILKLIDAK